MNAKILQFPGRRLESGGATVETVVIEDDDFDTVRAAIEQEVENAAHDLGQCETEGQWLDQVNALIERLVEAALRKGPG